MKRLLAAAVRDVLTLIGVSPDDRDADRRIAAQRHDHADALEAVRDAKAGALRVRAEANDVIAEARRAEAFLEGRG